jgi:hypothetical protein
VHPSFASLSPQYLHQYAKEAAWKEDHRRIDNGALESRALSLTIRIRSQRTDVAIGKVPCDLPHRHAFAVEAGPARRPGKARGRKSLEAFWQHISEHSVNQQRRSQSQKRKKYWLFSQLRG